MTQLPANAGDLLLPLARTAIESELGRPTRDRLPSVEWLAAPGASFVTLERHRDLAADVRSNARAAAFADPRFAPLTRQELPGLLVEVSVLSTPEPVPAASLEEAVDRLRPGIDGVILRVGERSSTFLPQVWDQIGDPYDFVRQLQRKAGVSDRGWDPRTRLLRYTVTAWREDNDVATPSTPGIPGEEEP